MYNGLIVLHSLGIFIFYFCERIANFQSVCCINLGSGVSKTVHFDQSQMRRMVLSRYSVNIVPNIPTKHQYTEYSPMAERTRKKITHFFIFFIERVVSF